MREQKGITLIALVITIIVLLILAGVSIAMLTGDNGILTRATDAADQTTLAGIEEKVNIAIQAAYVDTLKPDATSKTVTIANIMAQYISDNGANSAKTTTATGFTVTENSIEYTVALKASGNSYEVDTITEVK